MLILRLNLGKSWGEVRGVTLSQHTVYLAKAHQSIDEIIHSELLCKICLKQWVLWFWLMMLNYFMKQTKAHFLQLCKLNMSYNFIQLYTE